MNLHTIATRKSGSGGWDRTADARINSPLLYQLSYSEIRLGVTGEI